MECNFTGFGSALNIETLVAAAEKRETPIEVLASTFYNFHQKLLIYGVNQCLLG